MGCPQPRYGVLRAGIHEGVNSRGERWSCLVAGIASFAPLCGLWQHMYHGIMPVASSILGRVEEQAAAAAADRDAASPVVLLRGLSCHSATCQTSCQRTHHASLACTACSGCCVCRGLVPRGTTGRHHGAAGHTRTVLHHGFVASATKKSNSQRQHNPATAAAFKACTRCPAVLLKVCKPQDPARPVQQRTRYHGPAAGRQRQQPAG